MRPPFTSEQFLDVFARYNTTVWPMPVVFYGLAALLIYWSIRGAGPTDRWISGSLAFLWAWMGVVYHWTFFAAINPVAWVFGAFFVAQAGVFVVVGWRGEGLSFRFRNDRYGIAGAAFLAYALILYPILGALGGHAYPEGPTFGLPCPTTIATFGLLLWADGRVPPWVLAIPFLWSLLGPSAALQLGILEDMGLLVAGIVGLVMVIAKNRRLRRAGTPGPVAA